MSGEENNIPSFRELGLCEQLCKTVEKLGWHKPTPIQAQAIPWALKQRDVIGLAQTGSGKTGSFLLPVLDALVKNPSGLFALVLAPTRELAFQIAEQCEALGADIGATCATIVGGIDLMTQALALAKKPHIVVGTPGRVVYHLQNTKGFSLSKIKFLVLDEADRLLNLDFEEEIDMILKVIPKERTSFLFSATMTSKVAKLQRASLRNPVKVEVSTKYSTVDTLVQNYMFLPEQYRDCYLCTTAQRLAIVLRNLGFAAIPLHGKLTQTKRLGALNKFKAGHRKILVATDVASRGLDIPQVDLVINYEIPKHPKDYIHRVGRTARAGQAGRAISLVTQYDVEDYQKIEEHVGKKFDLFPSEEETVLVFMERVAEAQRLAAAEMRQADFSNNKKRKAPTNKGPQKAKRQKTA